MNFNYQASSQIQDLSRNHYLLRKASKEDIKIVTNLIRESYQHWVAVGLKVRPAFQTEETTETHLLNGGMVLEKKDHEIVGTFSFDTAKVTHQDSFLMADYTNPSEHVEYAPKLETNQQSIDGKYLVFKKLAISPSLQKAGLGRKLYDFAEEYGRTKAFKGMMLETIVEADWLYQWYINMGFEVIGGVTYAGSEIETLLLRKFFDRKNN